VNSPADPHPLFHDASIIQIPRLLTPGPVPVPPEVLEILARPIEHHRTPEFLKVFRNLMTLLPRVFGTSQPAFVQTCTGSGGMESLMVNVLSPGDRVGVIVSGKFGERWAEMAQAYGAIVRRFEVPWGESVDPVQLEAWLRAEEPLHILMSQVCETSTGALHPVREIVQLARARHSDTLVLLDAITALGALSLPMDEWDIDGMVGGSQKAFMLPTGLALLAWSERAWKKIPQARAPRSYFDIRAERAANQKGESHFSSPVPLLRALEYILSRIEAAGAPHWQYRIAGLSLATRSALTHLGLKVFPRVPSPTLTAIAVPEGIDGQKWREKLEVEYGLILMGGQDQLKGRVLRIGHMGYIRDEDLLAAIAGLADSLESLRPNSVSPEQRAEALRVAQSVLTQHPFVLVSHTSSETEGLR
jgi:aspartate aminotransferase-like enzyme